MVSSQADFNSTVSKKAALDLYEDVTTAVRLTQNGLDKELIDQIVDIFRTHPVCLVQLVLYFSPEAYLMVSWFPSLGIYILWY